jgi:superfamily II DNA/RNA helicase
LLLLLLLLFPGGVKMQRDVRLLTGDHHQGNLLPTILVSTPARLLEHLDGNSPLSKNFKSNPHQKQQGEIGWQRRNKSKFADLVAETKIIVLDETDRLLQGSNLYDTQRILSFMARTEKRQTLLFSATFPRQVRRLLLNSSIVKKKKKTDEDEDELLEVDCIDDVDERMDEDANNPNNISATTSPAAEVELSSVSTNQRRVEECYVSLENMSQFIPLLLTILRREQQRDSQNYKILVFFPAGRLVRFLFQFFTMGGRGRDSSSKRNTSQLLADDNDNDIIWEIHSRMSQSSRSRASNAFRNARRGILFSSDVSARGLDYPDVSLVVQMGAPSSEQDYIHRIGRTGRAGKLGRSLLVLLPFEIHHKQERWQKAQRRRLGQSSDDDYIKEDEQLASWLRVQNEEQNGNRNGEEGGKEEEKMRISSVSLFQQCQDDLEPTRLKIRSYHVVLTPSAQAAYISFLAHYIATATTSSPNGNRKNNSSNSRSRSRSKAQNKLQPSKILAYADDFARGTGLASIPELDETFATKLGLH